MPITSFGHQGGRRVSCEGTTFLNYVLHIFARGAKNLAGDCGTGLEGFRSRLGLEGYRSQDFEYRKEMAL